MQSTKVIIIYYEEYTELHVEWVVRPRQNAVARPDDLVGRELATGSSGRQRNKPIIFMFVEERR